MDGGALGAQAQLRPAPCDRPARPPPPPPRTPPGARLPDPRTRGLGSHLGRGLQTRSRCCCSPASVCVLPRPQAAGRAADVWTRRWSESATLQAGAPGLHPAPPAAAPLGPRAWGSALIRKAPAPWRTGRAPGSCRSAVPCEFPGRHSHPSLSGTLSASAQVMSHTPADLRGDPRTPTHPAVPSDGRARGGNSARSTNDPQTRPFQNLLPFPRDGESRE